MKPTIRTLAGARRFVVTAGICGIFSDAGETMPSLWDIVDLPGRQPGEKGWGQKVTSIWRWKNELPAKYPDEIFYGKIPGGLAVLMSLEYLRGHHARHHVPPGECSPLARKILELLRFDPLTTAGVRRELCLAGRPERNRVDRALQELQVTLNIARRNDPADERDTWVLFREQYPDIARG